MTCVAVRPNLSRGACAPADIVYAGQLRGRLPKLARCKAADTKLTLTRLDAFAQSVRVPVGYPLPPEAQEESLPIPNFRTRDGLRAERTSPNLLYTLYPCKERRRWHREFALTEHMAEVAYEGSADRGDRPQDVAARMGQGLGFDVAARAACRTRDEALRVLLTQPVAAGVLVMPRAT